MERTWYQRLKTRLRLPNFTCDVCGRELFDGARICSDCIGRLPYIGICCPLCGRRVKEAGVCVECKARRLAAGKCRSVCTHDGEASRLVMRYKDGSRYLSTAIADLMLPVLEREFPDVQALVPVPATEAAKKRRGFDHVRSRLVAAFPCSMRLLNKRRRRNKRRCPAVNARKISKAVFTSETARRSKTKFF